MILAPPSGLLPTKMTRSDALVGERGRRVHGFDRRPHFFLKSIFLKVSVIGLLSRSLPSLGRQCDAGHLRVEQRILGGEKLLPLIVLNPFNHHPADHHGNKKQDKEGEHRHQPDRVTK